MAPAAAPETIRIDAEGDDLVTGEAVGLDLRPTGFVLAAAGAAIDVATTGALLVLLLLLLVWLGAVLAVDGSTFAALTIVTLVVCLVGVPTVVETLTRGMSLGRLAVGSRIVRDDGGAIGLRHAFVRALVGVLELYLTAGGLAALVGLLNPRAKRLGDLLAGTYPQYERVRRVAPPAFGVPVPLVAWAATADVARMPDPLARRIAHFLSTAPHLEPLTRARIAAGLAAEAARWVHPVPAADPELFLAAVAATRRERESTALRLERERLARLAPALEAQPHGFPDRG